MTLEEKIGQMLLFGWAAESAAGPNPSEGYPGAVAETPATDVTPRLRTMLTEWKIGGVILMGRNVDSPEQVAALSNDIQALCETPVFLSTDQEGGHVCRMRKPFTVMPGNMALGATGDATLAYAAARAVSEELNAIGINLDFAPCMDVNNNPDNPIIGVRSYGADPRLVAELGAAQVRGYQENGTIACAKHFPGHGDTNVDSHLGLPSIPYAMDRLEQVELPPFRAAIDAGLAFVMTAHIVFETLDRERPGTLSPHVVNGVLRERLGYDGVVITDCMEMRAIADRWGVPEGAVMAVEAGVDVVAACHTFQRQAAVRQALLDAVRSGRLSEDRIDQSVRRIMACKQRFGLAQRRAVDVAAVPRIVGSAEHRAVEQDIARKSIVVVKDDAARIPLPLGRTVVVGPTETARALANEMSAARMVHHLDTGAFSDVAMGRMADVSSVGVGPEFTPEQLAGVPARADGADSVVFLTKHREPWTVTPQDEDAQAALVRDLNARGMPLVVVALRNPYDLRRFPEIPTYVCTLGYTPASLAALAEVLVGAVPAQGRLPVTIPVNADSAGPALEGDTTEWGGF